MKITVHMSPSTTTTLAQRGFRLLAYRATTCNDGAAQPLTWAEVPFSAVTALDFPRELEGYTSLNPVQPHAVIKPSNEVVAPIGTQLHVGIAGLLTSFHGKGDEAISFFNETESPQTCGLGSQCNQTTAAFIALPLLGRSRTAMRPLARVALRFSTNDYEIGRVLDDEFGGESPGSNGPAVIVDFASNEDRELRYDANSGWDWGGFSWATEQPANEPLSSLLIERTNSP